MASGLNDDDVSMFVDADIAMAEPVESHYMWRPLLRDPGDEVVLEAAANGRAAIATYSRRDFSTTPLQVGVDVLTPVQALRRIKQ
jgi:predicted nucleic acid-binding protein